MGRSTLLLVSMCTITSLAAQNSEIAEHEIAARTSSDENELLSGNDRVTVLEKQMQDLLTDTPLGNFGAKTAPARPQLNSNRLFLKGDGFLWKAFIGGNDFAAITEADAAIGESKRADFRWRWGFRAEMGYRLPHDQWDAVATYTWFHDKADRTAVSGPEETVIPLLPPYTSFAEGASASIQWHLRYQNLDAMLKKGYFLSRHFSVTPFFGLRNSWIDHGYKARYSDPNGEVPETIYVWAKQDFWGIGPVTGLSSEWHFSSQWMIFGSFNGSVLASDYDLSGQLLTSEGLQDKIKANTKRMSPTVQGALGFGWHMNFNRNRNHIALRFSYEAQYWWKQNLTIGYNSSYYSISRNGEDLGFHGFTLDALFDF